MAQGSCACGKIRVEVAGEPGPVALCHCTGCRKTTSSAYSSNIVVPKDSVKVTQGTPKEYTHAGESGKSSTNFFCGDCGSTLWREGEFFGPKKVVKVGIMDDPKWMKSAKPGAELYTTSRVDWLHPIDGLAQLEKMS